MSSEKRKVTVTSSSRICRDDDVENIIFTSDGEMTLDGGKISISYNEPDDEDGKSVKSVLSFRTDNGGEITISRSGGVNALLFFSEGERYNWQYDMGFATMEFCTATQSVSNTINYQKGGILSVKYTTESRGVLMQSVNFSVTVR